MLFGIDGTGNNGKPKVVVQAEGSTNVQGAMAYLSDDQLQFGCMKVVGVDTKGAVVSSRVKIIFFQWTGPNVSKIAFSRYGGVKATVSSYCNPHLTFEIYDRGELTEAEIELRLRQAGGAHQPDSYKFGSSDSVTILSETLQSGATQTPPSASFSPAAANSSGNTPDPAAQEATGRPAPAISGVSTPIADSAADSPASSSRVGASGHVRNNGLSSLNPVQSPSVPNTIGVSAKNLEQARKEIQRALLIAGTLSAKLNSIVDAAATASVNDSGEKVMTVPLVDVRNAHGTELGELNSRLTAILSLLEPNTV